MKQKTTTRQAPEVGELVAVDGCHGNYRPVLLAIEDDGETGVVQTVGLGEESQRRLSMATLRKAPPKKQRSRR